MPNRRVSSESAEMAVARMRKTASYQRGRFELERRRARIPSIQRTRHERIEFIVLPHVVAVAEEFSRRLLLANTHPYLPGKHPIVIEARDRAELKAESSWPTHISAWKEWHKINLHTAPEFSKLLSFIEARNAIMHGLGQLTRRQLKAEPLSSLAGRLKKIGVTLNGTQLIFGKSCVGRCADVASKFVFWLDGQCQENGLLPEKNEA